MESLDAYYWPDTRDYFWRDDDGKYISAPAASISRILKDWGYSGRTPENETLSPKDRALVYIEKKKNVSYAGPLAGYRVGIREFEGEKLLITKALKLIEPKAGEWKNLESFFVGLLGLEQAYVVYGWLKFALKALYESEYSPGQALVIAGPAQCGKTLCQALITELLGKRRGKPYRYMTGQTQFNSDLFLACSQVIGDENDSLDPRARATFAKEIKQHTVEEAQSCHPKNGRAIILNPIWRLSITLNDDPEALKVLPGFEDGIRDKIILLKAQHFDMPCPDGSRKERWELLTGEMPAFVHYLLNDFSIPEKWEDSRFGIVHYHNPKLLSIVDASSEEYLLLELIDTCEQLWDSPLTEFWEGRSTELDKILVEGHGRLASKLLSYPTKCGRLLGILEGKRADRVTRRSLNGTNLFKVTPPPKGIVEEFEPVQSESESPKSDPDEQPF